MKKPIFTGSGTALVTPFRDGAVDMEALARLIERQLQAGTEALIVCATTGEGPTLSREERRAIIRESLSAAARRVPVIVGTGSNSTALAAELSREAESLGADAVLVVTPYYNKATAAGLIAHYTAVADAIHIPMILYNVPSRTGVSCTAETYRVLSAHPNIVGVKEASGDLALVRDTRRACDLCVWSGNDEDTADIMLLGGAGVISTAANLIPGDMARLTQLCREGRFPQAAELQLRLTPLLRALFCEVNPIPVKTALARLGLCSGELRLPLCAMEEGHRAELFAAMGSLSLL